MKLKTMINPCIDCPFRKDTQRGISSKTVKFIFGRKDNLCHKTTEHWSDPDNISALAYDSEAQYCKGSILSRSKRTYKGINRSLIRMLITHSSKLARRAFNYYNTKR